MTRPAGSAVRVVALLLVLAVVASSLLGLAHFAIDGGHHDGDCGSCALLFRPLIAPDPGAYPPLAAPEAGEPDRFHEPPRLACAAPRRAGLPRAPPCAA